MLHILSLCAYGKYAKLQNCQLVLQQKDVVLEEWYVVNGSLFECPGNNNLLLTLSTRQKS